MHEVVGVEPQLELGPVVGAGELLLGLAQVGVGRRDDQLLGREVQQHAARPLAGQQRDTLHGLRERLPLEHRPLVVVLGDHPLVVGEGALEDAAGQLALAQAKAEVVLAAAVGHGLVAVEAHQLLQRLARNQHALLRGMHGHLLAVLTAGGSLDEGQPVAVGGHHLEPVRAAAALLGLEQRAVELEARLLGGDGEDHLGDHAAQHREADLDGGIPIHLGQGRKVVGLEPADAEAAAPGLDDDARGLVDRELDLRFAERAHDLVKLLRLHRDGAVAADVAGAPGRERDVEVGRGERELAVARVEQQMGEDRDGRPPLHDALQEGELGEQGVALEADFHSLCSLLETGREYSIGIVAGSAAERAENPRRSKRRSALGTSSRLRNRCGCGAEARWESAICDALHRASSGRLRRGAEKALAGRFLPTRKCSTTERASP